MFGVEMCNVVHVCTSSSMRSVNDSVAAVMD